MAKSKKASQKDANAEVGAIAPGYEGNQFCDEASVLWDREQDWLEPEEALSIVTTTGNWGVEWCGGEIEVGRSGEPLPEYIPKHLITIKKATRLRSKRSVPTVAVAELWKNDLGEDLVIFHESGPCPRTLGAPAR